MENNNNIFGTIRQEINDFVYNYIEVVPGYEFNQYETIKQIHLYTNNRFVDNAPYQGRNKIFFNAVNYRRDTVAKMLNIDTKDVRLWPMNPKNEMSTFLMEKELKLWMKKNKIGILFNDLAEEAPTFGTAVMRKTKKGAELVDLRRLFLDPTVDNIEKSRFVTTKYYLTINDLREKIKDGWDADEVEKIIARKERQLTDAPPSYDQALGQVTNQIRSSPYIEVYERFGEVPEYVLTDKQPTLKNSELVRALFIVAEPFYTTASTGANGTQFTTDNGAVLFKSKWLKAWPFKDYHFTKTKGRWLGVGVIEALFPVQERINELANQKRISMEISTIHLFQTQSNTFVKNLLSDVQNADILTVDQKIEPIVNEERNLPAFSSETAQYDALADRMSFTFDAARGEGNTASTTATNSLLQSASLSSYFKFKRENLGLFLQEFFNDFVLPQLRKDLKDPHILRFFGSAEELIKVDEQYVKVLVRDWAMKNVLDGKPVPTFDELQMHTEKLMLDMKKKGYNRFIDVVDNLYGDLEVEFDIVVVPEQEDISAIAQNTFQILTVVAQNPQVMENPVLKALLFKYAQRLGISMTELNLADTQRQEMIQAGGGIPAANGGAGGQNVQLPGQIPTAAQAMGGSRVANVIASGV